MIKLRMQTSHSRFACYTRRWRLAQREGRRGTAMVEFSLVAPVLLLLLFGIIEFALAIHTQVDYGNAVSNGIREATIDADKYQNDDLITSKLFQTMRQDDPDRANYYAIQLVYSRNYTDTTNLYENVYGYNQSTHAFEVEPFTFTANSATAISNFGFSNVDYCKYFYQVHTSSGKVYLDAQNTIKIGPLASDEDSGVSTHFATALASIQSGCGRTGSDTLTCTANGAHYPFMDSMSITVNGATNALTGKLCYYYPTERIANIDTVGLSGLSTLPDLIEIAINYTYKPFGNYVTAHSPLGLGFTITEHARARLEPTTRVQ